MPASPLVNACCASVCSAALLLCAAPLHAAAAVPSLPDPTRPAVFAEPAASAASPRRSDAAATIPAAPQLQSVQHSANGGSTALVDGRIVRVGGRVGELTVLAIDEQGLLLRGARQDQRLTLLPGATKLASGTAPPTPRATMTIATTKEIK